MGRMDEAEVIAAAKELIDRDGGKWHHEIHPPKRIPRLPREWSVVVNCCRGDATVDQPTVIVVDDATGEARYFD